MFTKAKIAVLVATMAFAAPAMAANPSRIVGNVQTATASVVPLPAIALSNGIVIKADPSNVGTIYVGPCDILTVNNGFPLAANEGIPYGVSNLSAVCLIGDTTAVGAGDKLRFTGN